MRTPVMLGPGQARTLDVIAAYHRETGRGITHRGLMARLGRSKSRVRVLITRLHQTGLVTAGATPDGHRATAGTLLVARPYAVDGAGRVTPLAVVPQPAHPDVVAEARR